MVSITNTGEFVRRAVVESKWYYLIEDSERRSTVDIYSEPYTRRAIITVTVAHLINEGIRRAIIDVSSDHTRRAVVAVDYGGEIRRGKVKVFTRWFYGGQPRRSIVSIVRLQDYNRRSEVFAIFVGQDNRRSVVYGLKVDDYTRRATTYVMTSSSITRRAVVVAAERERVRLTIILNER